MALGAETGGKKAAEPAGGAGEENAHGVFITRAAPSVPPGKNHLLRKPSLFLTPSGAAPVTQSPPLSAMTALIFMGVSGSGKSTIAADVAAHLGWPMVEGDDLHPPANIGKMTAGIPLTDADRKPWLEAIAARIAEWRAAGEHGVITCSALKRAYRTILRAGETDVRFVYLDGSYELLLDRMQHRKRHFMPASLLRSQFDTLQPPGPDEALIVSIDQPEAATVAEVLARLATG